MEDNTPPNDAINKFEKEKAEYIDIISGLRAINSKVNTLPVWFTNISVGVLAFFTGFLIQLRSEDYQFNLYLSLTFFVFILISIGIGLYLRFSFEYNSIIINMLELTERLVSNMDRVIEKADFEGEYDKVIEDLKSAKEDYREERRSLQNEDLSRAKYITYQCLSLIVAFSIFLYFFIDYVYT